MEEKISILKGIKTTVYVSTPVLKTVMKSLNVKKQLVSVLKVNNETYISITDIARFKNPKEPKDVVKN